MDHIEAFILAGGTSSRMGSDKSRLLIDGQTFTERIAATLLKITTSVTVVGQRFDDLGLKSVADCYPQWGALGGLHAALTTCEADWAVVVACDLPFVTVELISRLASFRDDFQAVVPVQPDERPQPLCGLYRVDPCREQANKLIQAGRRRPLDLLQAVRTRWLLFTEIQDLDQAEKFFVNINTPEDYYEATRKGGRT